MHCTLCAFAVKILFPAMFHWEDHADYSDRTGLRQLKYNLLFLLTVNFSLVSCSD
jgi:hypothetical protein